MKATNKKIEYLL